MDCATKNPHWNEGIALGYDTLENISLINKDGMAKVEFGRYYQNCGLMAGFCRKYDH